VKYLDFQKDLSFPGHVFDEFPKQYHELDCEKNGVYFVHEILDLLYAFLLIKLQIGLYYNIFWNSSFVKIQDTGINNLYGLKMYRILKYFVV